MSSKKQFRFFPPFLPLQAPAVSAVFPLLAAGMNHHGGVDDYYDIMRQPSEGATVGGVSLHTKFEPKGGVLDASIGRIRVELGPVINTCTWRGHEAEAIGALDQRHHPR